MGWEAWLTVGVIIAMVAALVKNVTGPDVILLGGLTVLMTAGTFTSKLPGPAEAVAGFGNAGAITIGVLFVVAAGLTQTGAMQRLTAPLLGRPRTIFAAQARLIFPIAGLSAFFNNTPLVAMFMPVVDDWCKKSNMAASKLFLPLSYAAILGGTCTLIGTSTNLVVNGLLIADPRFRGAGQGMGLFEIGAVGLPCTVVGLIYLLVFGRRLLPDRRPALSAAADPRQYTVEMLVDAHGGLVGQTIEQAGLRHLPGLYLLEIERDNHVLPAVGPREKLRARDRLVFVGVVESVVDLRKTRGLTPATSQVFKLDAPHAQRTLIEAVVSNSCPLIGKSIREGRFRTNYDAAVIAVARNGQRIDKKIGDIVLAPGDTLLLEAHQSFVDQRRNSRDFFLVSRVAGSTPPRHERAWAALMILAGLVVVVATGWLSMLNGALIAAGLMWLSRCTSANAARQAIDWQVLLVIGAALGIGQAVTQSGLALTVAHAILGAIGSRPMLALLAVYLITNLFTELITNNAAAVLVYPIAHATADSLGVHVMPFIAVLMIAASASFSTPIGYQTNLMVFGPGGYRFTDYLRLGLPLNLLIMAVTLTLAPIVWGF